MADGVKYAEAAARHGMGPDEKAVRAAFSALKEHGVTFFRDGGDKFGVSRLAKTLAPEYGVDYRMPCFIIHRAGYYGELYGKAYRDMREARELIREAKRQGADFIKIAVSGMLDFMSDGRVMGNAIDRAEIRELSRMASGEGLRVMAHCNGAENIKNALEAGITSIEHGFWIDREGVHMLVETGAIWTPTLAPVANLVGANTGFSENALRAILLSHRELLVYARDKGALIASGSDCGARGVPHGQGTDDELRYLAELNIDPSPANARVFELFRQ
jgi:imidazolonepropionase-like amidohydrolase